MVVHGLCVEAMVLVWHDGDVGELVFLTGREEAALPEVGHVEVHQHSHARTFKQVASELCHLLLEKCRLVRITAIEEILVEDPPPDVREGEERGNGRVSATFHVQRVGDEASLPRSTLSSDDSVRLHKQPGHQQSHQDDLAKEQVCYRFHQLAYII